MNPTAGKRNRLKPVAGPIGNQASAGSYLAQAVLDAISRVLSRCLIRAHQLRMTMIQ